MKDVCKPEIVVIDCSACIAKPSSTFFAPICLHTIFDTLLNRLCTSAIGAKVPVF